MCARANLGTIMKFFFSLSIIIASALLSGCEPSRNANTRNTAVVQGGSVRTYRVGDRLLVAGSAKLPHGVTNPARAHVDVRLTGEGGKVLADEAVAFNGTGRPIDVRSNKAGFSGSFPAALQPAIREIDVTVHSGSAGVCHG